MGKVRKRNSKFRANNVVRDIDDMKARSHIEPTDMIMLNDTNASQSKVNRINEGKLIKKKDKRKARKQKLFTKLQLLHNSKQNGSKKQKQKSNVFENLMSLKDALPQLPQNSAGIKHTQGECSLFVPKKAQNNARKHWKARKTGDLEDIKAFESVLKLSDYKSDPLGAISNHIEYLTKAELV